MNREIDILTNRVAELDEAEAAIARRQKEIDSERRAISVEREELAVALRVLSRLCGVNAGRTVEIFKAMAPAEEDKPADIPTMPEMIFAVLGAESATSEMEPKEIAEIIRLIYWPEVVVNNVASACWRLWKRGRLMKDEGSSAYRLPQTNEGPDEHLGGNPSEPSDPKPPAKGREAVPGGGT